MFSLVKDPHVCMIISQEDIVYKNMNIEFVKINTFKNRSVWTIYRDIKSIFVFILKSYKLLARINLLLLCLILCACYVILEDCNVRMVPKEYLNLSKIIQ